MHCLLVCHLKFAAACVLSRQAIGNEYVSQKVCAKKILKFIMFSAVDQ